MAITSAGEGGWDAVTKMTESMLGHARAGEWEQVIRIESDRQILIKQFFSNNRPESCASDIADGITRVMETDRQIMKLGKSGLQEMSKHLQAIQTGRQATNAYKAYS